MPKRALILGGGQIGCAAAGAFAAAGWQVVLLSRSAPLAPLPSAQAIEHRQVDRDDAPALRGALGGGADFLLDSVAYTPEQARQLLDFGGSLGNICFISTGSVYADASGRGIEDAAGRGFPEFPEPITEDQATVQPGDSSYSTRKRAAELLLLDRARVPLSILRPAAIYGLGSRQPREWWFVKRLLDGRGRIPLLHGGSSRFHTSGVRNIAALALTLAETGQGGIFNAVDPAAPDVREIGHAVMAALGREAELVPVPSSQTHPQVGRSPWAVPSPLVFSDAAARAAGYRPVGPYAEEVRPVVEWLRSFAERDWRAAFPTLAGYPWDLFDYAAEDEVLARLG